MKMLISTLIVFILFINISDVTILAQDVIQVNNHDEIVPGKLNVKTISSLQLGISLRDNAINLNYKQNLKNNKRLRASLRVPKISFSQANNREYIAVQNLGAAIGLEKNIVTSKFFDIYGGAEVSTHLDIASNFARTSFFVHAIVGIAAKISDNIYAFGEIQPGVELLGRNNFQQKYLRSSRALNLGFMWNLNS